MSSCVQVLFRSLIIIYIVDTDHYSCSLSCFKSHEVQCIVDDNNKSSLDAPQSHSNGDMNPSSPSLVADRASTGQQVEQLFKDNPELRGKLKLIYEASLDPSTLSDNRAGRYESNWSEQKGFSRALELFRRQVSDPDAAPDLKAFVDFVAQA